MYAHKHVNLIYGVRLRVNVGDSLKKSFSVLLHFPEKKLKKTSFVSDEHFREDSVNFSFSIFQSAISKIV